MRADQDLVLTLLRAEPERWMQAREIAEALGVERTSVYVPLGGLFARRLVVRQETRGGPGGMGWAWRAA